MSSIPPHPHTPKATVRQRRLHRLWAWGFVALGTVLLAANLGMLPRPTEQAVRLIWPAGVVAAGLWLIVAGRPKTGAGVPAFAVERGEAQAGELVAACGTADLQVQAFAGASQLIVGQFPAPQGPRVAAHATTTRVVLSPRLALPLLPGRCWSTALAKGLPWVLDLGSSLGDFDLNLRDLTISALRLRTTLGHVDLTLPAAGQGEFELRLILGDVTVRVPDEMAVRVKVATGPLGKVRADSRRFVELAPGEWASPLFAVSAERYTLRLYLGAGALRLV
ncbi:MAG: hypothetical protein IT318_09960 [Anaerolineales bacterium]|nr:hypothetical protein [Anaerolineales bacterium]